MIYNEKDDLCIEMADSYAKMFAERYMYKIEANKSMMGLGENNNSILGAITVGVISFVIRTIVEFVKYITWTIKYMIIDSGIIQNILSGIMSIFGESSTPTRPIKVSNPNELTNLVKSQSKIILNKLNRVNETSSRKLVLFDNESMVDKMYAIIEPSVTNSYRDNFSKLFAFEGANEYKFDKPVSGMIREYKRYLDDTRASKLKINNYVTLNNVADIKNTISTYKDILNDFYNNVHLRSCDFFKAIETKITQVLNRLNVLEKYPEKASVEDELIINFSNRLLVYVIKDMKNITDVHIWLKNQIVSNLLTMCNKGGQ